MIDSETAQTELRPTLMRVSLDALAENYSTLRSLMPSSKMMAVVKANAYGHGLIPCAKHFLECGAEYLGVALIEEGIQLRQAGIEAPILVFGGIFGGQIQHYLEYDLELTASSISKLEQIQNVAKDFGKRAKVHLKLDTGMGRIGVRWSNAEEFFKKALSLSMLEVRGVFSHLATLNEEEPKPGSFTLEQVGRFKDSREIFRSLSDSPALFHLGGSSAVIDCPQAHFDMLRPGIALFGVYPDKRLFPKVDLKLAMQLESKIVYFKVVTPGMGVSYGHDWVAAKQTRIVTIPIGYGDGYMRRLSNEAEVLINGKRYPVRGRVCMDQIMVDVGNDTAFNGDVVVLLGSQENAEGKTETIRPLELAEIAGTSPYEIITAFNKRMPRVYC